MAPISRSKNAGTPRLFSYIGVFLLCFIPAAVLVGLHPVGSSSEAREGQVIRVIVRSGEWVLPLRNGIVPSKPPLYHWIGALLSKVTGRTDEFGMRLPSLFAATFLILLVLAIAGMVPERRSARTAQMPRDRDNSAFSPGNIAMLVIISTYGFYSMAVEGMVDMVFSLFVLSATSCLVVPLLRTSKEGRSLRSMEEEVAFLGLYGFSGLAVLTKGPLGLVLPILLAFAGTVWILGLRSAFNKFLRPRLGWLLFPIIVLPWYLGAAKLGGDAFLDRQLLFENLKRFSGGEFVNSKPWWFYFPSFLRTSFPWSIVAIALVLWDWVRAKEASACLVEESFSDRKIRSTFIIMFLTALLLFSFASGKRHSYLLPIFPFLAIYIGLAVSDLMQLMMDKSQGAINAVLTGQSFLPMALIAVLILALELGRFALVYDSEAVLASLGWMRGVVGRVEALLLLTLLMLAFVRMRINFIPKWGVAKTFAITLWIFLLSLQVIGLGIKNNIKQFHRIAESVKSKVPSMEPLTVVKGKMEEFFDPLFYYLDREVNIENLESKQFPSGTFVLSRVEWFNDFASSHSEVNLTRIAQYSEIVRPGKVKGLNEIVLFRVN